MFFVLQVKQAYKKLALRWHPDLLPAHERPQAEATFKDISAAYAKITQGVKLCIHNDCAASRMQASRSLQELAQDSQAQDTQQHHMHPKEVLYQVDR